MCILLVSYIAYLQVYHLHFSVQLFRDVCVYLL